MLNCFHAPRSYSVELLSSNSFYVLENEQTIELAAKAGGGWRRSGVLISNPKLNKSTTLPKEIHLVWWAPTENKFYYLDLLLPLIEMKQFLKEGFYSIRSQTKLKKKTYNSISFAIAPGGQVFLRLDGEQSHEMAYFQGKELPISWEEYARSELLYAQAYSREEYLALYTKKLSDDVKRRIKKQDFPIGRWQRYSDTVYAWSIRFMNGKLEEYWVEFVNADCYMVFRDKINDEAQKSLRVPVYFDLYIIDKNNQRYCISINLSLCLIGMPEQPEDDLQIFESFKKHFEKALGFSTLLISFKKNSTEIEAVLSNGKNKTSLKIVEQKIKKLKPRKYA